MRRIVLTGFGLLLAGVFLVVISRGQKQQQTASPTPTASPAGSPTQQGTPLDAAKFDPPIELQPVDRFAGKVGVRSKRLTAAGGGPTNDLQITLRNWHIPNRQRIEHFPEQGFLIVQVRSGEDVVTVIDGQRQQRKAEEYFTVADGSTLSIETGNDSAIIQTVAIKKP